VDLKKLGNIEEFTHLPRYDNVQTGEIFSHTHTRKAIGMQNALSSMP